MVAAKTDDGSRVPILQHWSIQIQSKFVTEMKQIIDRIVYHFLQIITNTEVAARSAIIEQVLVFYNPKRLATSSTLRVHIPFSNKR